MSEAKFQVGDWVRVEDGLSEGATGHIVGPAKRSEIGVPMWKVVLAGLRTRIVREDFLRLMECPGRPKDTYLMMESGTLREVEVPNKEWLLDERIRLLERLVLEQKATIAELQKNIGTLEKQVDLLWGR